jgi:hypothetical protein
VLLQQQSSIRHERPKAKVRKPQTLRREEVAKQANEAAAVSFKKAKAKRDREKATHHQNAS